MFATNFSVVFIAVTVRVTIWVVAVHGQVQAQHLCSSDPITAYVNRTYKRVAQSDNTCTFNFALDLVGLTDYEILDKKVQLYVAIDDRNNTENWKQPLMVS